MAKVLVAEKVCDKGLDILRQQGIEVDYKPRISREELLQTIGEYDGLIVRSQPTVDEELYQSAKNLKVVGRAGNGVDNIDMDGATKRGIIVVNTPDANSVSACELTIGMILASCRNIPQANISVKNGVWGRSRFQGTELRGKTLGIVGLGRIGSLLAQRMNAFGMKVIAYDPYITDARFARVQAEKKHTLEELVKEADIITVHTPKTSETMGMIGENEFKLMKKDVRIINCARGGIVNEHALAKAMEDGIVASAACDVLIKEPCTDCPLYAFDNFIVTPHIGATTNEAQENVGISVAQEVAAALKGEMVPNAVNLPVLNREDLMVLTPFIRLAEVLGKFYHQLEKPPIEKVEIVYCGINPAIDTELVSVAVLKGLFEPILKERVNYVNARLVAQSRDIFVIESKTSQTGNNNAGMIRLKVFAGGQEHHYNGAIFNSDEPRITEIEEFKFNLRPEGYMLVIENMDAPGMVGRIGTVLGENNINIATMQVSRESQGNKAMMILGVDSVVSRDDLDIIAKVPGISKVRFVEL